MRGEKWSRQAASGDRSRDHPRIRGEKHYAQGGEITWAGSPPHTRGKALTGDEGLIIHRITPAYAGKSGEGDQIIAWQEDHPRMRGEKSLRFVPWTKAKGSPPHARGKGARRYGDHGRERITPRIRGEKSRAKQCPADCIGSPPHTRGKGTSLGTMQLASGITPACAGKSFSARFMVFFT